MAHAVIGHNGGTVKPRLNRRKILVGASALAAATALAKSSFAAPYIRSTRQSLWVDPVDYGAIADGSAHALSTRYGSLAAAQVDYPFTTALTQQIDFCAVQQASNVAFGASGSENASNSYLNKRLHISGGKYIFGNDTWKIRKLYSGVIEGDGKDVTQLSSNVTVLQTDGCWKTYFNAFMLNLLTTTGTVAFDVDGNTGHAGATNGVQGNTFSNLEIVGGGSSYGMAICRVGAGYGQGSENTIQNCHFQGTSFACYYQNGQNAIANLIIGGDMQSFQKYGVYGIGTLSVYGTSFQSTYGYTQILNDGYDIRVGDAAAYEGCVFINCRSESPRFFYNAGAVRSFVAGCVGNMAGINGWLAGHVYAANSAIWMTCAVDGIKHIYVTSAGGTSGGTAPNWPFTGNVTDNTITWSEFPYYFIYNTFGAVDYQTCSSRNSGKTVAPAQGQVIPNKTSTYLVHNGDRVVPMDCTGGALTCYIPAQVNLQRGRTLTIMKVELVSKRTHNHKSWRLFCRHGCSKHHHLRRRARIVDPRL